MLHAFGDDMRKNAPDDWKDIMDEAIVKYDVTMQKAVDADMTIESLAEEHLADEVHYFAKNQEFKTKGLSGKLKKFIRDLWERIK